MTRKKLSRIMLGTNFICNLFYALSYPYIYAELVKAVNSRYISAEQIIQCSGIIVLGVLWNKIGDFLYKHFRVLIVAELIADAFLFGHVFITGDLKFYFVFNVITYAFVSRHIANGGIRLRAKVHPDEKSRERYDNNCNIANSAATLIGAGIALICPMGLSLLFVAAVIGNTFDNFCYWYIYNKINKIVAEETKSNADR